MRIQFSTAEYEQAHGEIPKGNGPWWLRIDTRDHTRTIRHKGTLGEARARVKRIAEEAGLRGVVKVKVLPLPNQSNES